MSGLSLQTFPPELIINILRHLDDPLDVLNAGLTCKDIHACAEDNAIWAGLTCLFKYWSTGDFRTSANSDWKSEIKRRYFQRPQIDLAIHGLIQSSVNGLLPHFQHITEGIGLEAKDRLLMHMRNTPDDAPDVLARKFWSKKLFGACQKQTALKVLGNALKGHTVPPEHVLTAVDMLIIEDEKADIGWVTAKLDQLVNDFKAVHGDWEFYSTRDLLDLVAAYLIEEKDFRGPLSYEASSQFDKLQIPAEFNFISKRLSIGNWRSSPLIDTVIFCAIISRLGVPAVPASFLKYYFAVVDDIRSSQGQSKNAEIYFDFYNEYPGTKSLEELETIVEDMGFGGATMQILSSLDLLRHMRRHCADNQYRLPDWIPEDMEAKSLTACLPELRLWLDLIVLTQESMESYIIKFCNLFNKAESNIWNVPLAIAHLLRKDSVESNPRLKAQILHELRRVEDSDANRRIVTWSRKKFGSASPKLKVGDCTRRVRYGHEGFVTGWVPHIPLYDHTSRFRSSENSPFQIVYRIIEEGGDVIFAAEESLMRIKSCSKVYMEEAGRYFLRWDDDEKRFVSNRREFYPED